MRNILKHCVAYRLTGDAMESAENLKQESAPNEEVAALVPVP